MKSISLKENIVVIDEECIQSEAMDELNRNLTSVELEHVYYTLLENSIDFIRDAITDVIRFNEMLGHNKGAEKAFPHYVVYHRNFNAYQPEFGKGQAFANEADAKEYIHHDFISEDDEWRLVQVNKDGTEQEVYKVN